MSRFFRNLALSLLTVLVLDLAVGQVIGSTYRLQSGGVERYFGYGFSIQSKLKAMLGEGELEPSSLVAAGWNASLPNRTPARDLSCQQRFTFYGMSFSNRVAEALVEQDPCISLRLVAGPGAPLSHSYAEYQRFHAQDDAEVVVIGVLASSLIKNLSTAHFNSAFEAPSSHMYPRYRLVDGRLEAAAPPATNLQEFRALLSSDVDRLEQFLAKNDEYYSPLVFGYPQLDRSVVVRMLRRAYGQSFKRNLIADYRTAEGGFENKNNLIDVSLAMLKSAADTAHKDNVRLIVLLINDRGYAEALDDALAEDLAALDVSYLSSTSVIDARDMSSFLPDGHFKPKLDRELASALRSLLP